MIEWVYVIMAVIVVLSVVYSVYLHISYERKVAELRLSRDVVGRLEVVIDEGDGSAYASVDVDVDMLNRYEYATFAIAITRVRSEE